MPLQLEKSSVASSNLGLPLSASLYNLEQLPAAQWHGLKVMDMSKITFFKVVISSGSILSPALELLPRTL